jgi:hypothetical protein
MQTKINHTKNRRQLNKSIKITNNSCSIKEFKGCIDDSKPNQFHINRKQWAKKSSITKYFLFMVESWSMNKIDGKKNSSGREFSLNLSLHHSQFIYFFWSLCQYLVSSINFKSVSLQWICSELYKKFSLILVESKSETSHEGNVNCSRILFLIPNLASY